jgi:hypothetical protein
MQGKAEDALPIAMKTAASTSAALKGLIYLTESRIPPA